MRSAKIDHLQFPLPLPDCQLERGVLVIARRTAIHGLHDAKAGLLALSLFRGSFRKPLALIRCLVHEVASTSSRTICIASCCAPRMTRDEGLLMEAIRGSGLPPMLALTDNENCGGTLMAAKMLGQEIRNMRLCSG